MKASDLYNKLEKDFKLSECKDRWSQMAFNKYISPNFKKRYMGIVLDNSKIIKKVFTAVFPTKSVIKFLTDNNEEDVLLFTHHPMVWDIRKERVYHDIKIKYLRMLKKNRISLYTLHMPLDHVSEYSVNVNLAKALGLKRVGEFFKYHGLTVGVIAETSIKTIHKLTEHVSKKLGHEVKMYKYGVDEIKRGKVGLIGGSGNLIPVHKELLSLGINTYITGVTAISEFSEGVHAFAKENKINIIGATHYSTEKFACIKMCEYFKKLGLYSEFIKGEPLMEDM